MKVEDLLHDRVFMTKIVWLGFWFGIFLMAIGLFVIIRDLI